MAKKPLVALVMGSTSDLPHVEPALEILKDLGIPYTARILSSHRTPEALSGFARNAKGRGIKVIVALAGAAAHLAGVIASYTDLPVIGVPMAVTTLAGFDALLSTGRRTPFASRLGYWPWKTRKSRGNWRRGGKTWPGTFSPRTRRWHPGSLGPGKKNDHGCSSPDHLGRRSAGQAGNH